MCFMFVFTEHKNLTAVHIQEYLRFDYMYFPNVFFAILISHLTFLFRLMYL
jgi:hypothetical protein